MLTPVPAAYHSASDPIGSNSDSILPSSPTGSDLSWPSPPSSPCSFETQRTQSKRRARTSNLARHQRHHYNRRPSKQFVATTSSAIFGDWDIELKIDHRTLARSKSNGEKTTTASSRGIGVGGSIGRGAGVSFTVGTGPGVHTGSSGTQPLSTLPSSSSSPISPFSIPTSNIDNSNNNDTTTKCHPPWRSHQKKNAKAVPSALTTSTVHAEVETIDAKQQQQQSPSVLHGPSPSGKSSFLKAISRFKSKHIQQSRSSAPLSPFPTIAEPLSEEGRQASCTLPPIHFEESETQTSSVAVKNTAASAQEHLAPTVSQEQEPAAPLMGEVIADGTASLRVKLKNKVHGALASMKSSSNLGDRAKTQHLESVDTSLEEQDQNNGERRHSALVLLSPDASEPQQALKWENSNHAVDGLTVSPKHRHSKNFWTFPRVRHESGQTSMGRHQPSWEAEDKDDTKLEDVLDTITHAPNARGLEETEDGSTTLYHQMQELKVDEFDSDKSLDIILPADYEDYTQFAELPLKKRKKMERSLAAAASDPHKRPNSMRASADAMKRFLKKQESGKSKDVAIEDCTAIEEQDQEISMINSNKKRPQVVPDTAEGSSKRSGQLVADWRRTLMKSLHLNKSENSSRKGANIDANALPEEGLQAAEVRRLSRSNSIHTTRSMSLTTSTHPALLATAVSKPRSPGLRRETLEMAMRRRRQSGATARLNIGEDEIPPPLPLSSEFFGVDNISTTNITHTFTSFTLELAEMHAREVMNNSSIPGLFNIKRRTPRLTVSSNIMELDTDHDFKGFDSDGDAISGYTGDADISMDEIHVRPPKAPAAAPSFKTRAREFSSGAAGLARRKISSIDGDSDTVPELPRLVIRTRDLNLRGSGHSRGNSGSYSRLGRPLSGSSFDMDLDSQLNNGVDNGPRSPRRSGQTSPPAITRMSGRGISTSPTSLSAMGPSSPVKLGRTSMSMEEIASWKPRNAHAQQLRPSIPTLDIKPLKPARGTGTSLTTTPITSSTSRTPNSASTLTQSPVMMTPTGERGFNIRNHYHQQSTSSSSTASQRHEHQMSGDTLVPSHLRYVSSGSVMSAGSGYSVHSNHGTLGAKEFDPNEEFPPTTPADLKAMDFETLLEAAEREQSKGWEDLMAQKKGFEDHLALPANAPPARTMSSLIGSTMANSTPFPLPPTFAPLKIASSTRNNRSNQQHQPLKQLSQLQQQQQRSSVAFDIAPSDDGTSGAMRGTATGSDRSTRTRRVMKKKMSVIRLAGSGYGNVQGRREDDGMIRVCVSPTPFAPTPRSHAITGRW